jgi:hypothetical protein
LAQLPSSLSTGIWREDVITLNVFQRRSTPVNGFFIHQGLFSVLKLIRSFKLNFLPIIHKSPRHCATPITKQNPTPLGGVGFQHYPIKAMPVETGYKTWPALRIAWSINTCTLLSCVLW